MNDKRLNSVPVQTLARDGIRVDRYRARSHFEPLGNAEEGAGVDEDPQYRMWKDRLDAEREVYAIRLAQIAARELSRAEWHAAWASYKARLVAASVALPLPRWWNVFGWVRWLLRLHAPGRSG